MKIKNWLIRKLGGLTREDIKSPIQYTIYRPKVKTIKAQFIDRGYEIPQEYVEEKLMHDLILFIKPYVKIEKIMNHFGECLYDAEINVLEMKE